MAKIDFEYFKLVDKILMEGKYTQNRTGVPTYQIPYYTMEFDLQDEFPILTTKKVNPESSILEFLWIYQQQTSDIRWLQERGIKIWDNWQIDEDGIYRKGPNGEINYGKKWANTAGNTYGERLRQTGDIDDVIHKLKNKPTDRRIMINLWNQETFSEAVLPPCVFNHQFSVSGEYLNMVTNQRSCDVALGVPFDFVHAGLLLSMLAHCTGYKSGKILYVMTNVHIYENHIDKLKEQWQHLKYAKEAPKLWLNPEVKDFYSFDSSKEHKDIKFEGYEYCTVIKLSAAT